MKKLSWLVIAFALVFASCDPLGFESSQNFDSNGVPLGTFTLTLADGTQVIACNSQEVCLWAGQTIDAGYVNISNDNTNLYITIFSEGGFQQTSDNFKIWVGANPDLTPGNGGVPVNKNGVPIPGKFPYKYTVTGNEYTAVIPFSSIEAYNGDRPTCNTLLYVYVHGDVIDPSGKAQTAWGGCLPGSEDVNRWYFYSTYQGKCCGTPPPPSDCTQTAFSYGTHVFTSDKKSNPDKLPMLNLTRNRWGWAVNLKDYNEVSYTIWAGAGLNYTSKGTNVGTFTAKWDGSNVTVTYQLSSPYLMSGLHVYAGDLAPTTVAPGLYGNIENFNPMTNYFTQTYSVNDTNGDGIWLIAHAGVYGACKK